MIDLKKPKGRRARKALKGPVTEFRCQFCHEASPVNDWVDRVTCPKCGLMYMEGAGWGN